MSRELNRIIQKRKSNPIVECNKIQKKFYPGLLSKFDHVKDPRHCSYTEYSCREMPGTLYYKGITGISSMQGMTREFTNETVTENLYRFMGREMKDYVPHGVTINEFPERLEPTELEEIQKDIAYQMIRRKTFDDAKVLGKWLVLVDGTELDEGYKKKNDYYLRRTYNRGEKNEITKYHRNVPESKIYFGNSLVCSIATEFIENTDEYNQKNMTEEALKQDCESKAFERLAKKLKKRFPRLPIKIVADGLYANTKVIKICKAVAGIIFRDEDVNVLKYTEKKIKKVVEEETNFAWITSIEITNKNAGKLVTAGRNRWKIENQGFNRQKRWQGNIEHAALMRRHRRIIT